MLVPRPDSVIISPIYDPSVSEGGIIIPEVAKERVDQGIVKYAGYACKYLAPGDYVLFTGYAGETIQMEDGNDDVLIMMQERLVIAIVGDDEWLTCSVPGLFHKDKDGNYFHATVETAIPLIKDAAAHARFIRPSLRYRKPDNLGAETLMEAEERWDEVHSVNDND